MSDPTYYHVDAIVGRRERDGVVQYRIKWTGYPRSQNTWEPHENLNPAALVSAEEYELKCKRNMANSAITTGHDANLEIA